MAAVEKFGFVVTTCCGYLPQVKPMYTCLNSRGRCTVLMSLSCVTNVWSPNLQDVKVNFSSITVFSHSYLSRTINGRVIGCHSTPSRGYSTSLTWWRNRMETGRPENYGLSYRCNLPLILFEIKHILHKTL